MKLRRFTRILLMAVLSACMLFLALGAAEEPALEIIEAEVPVVVILPIESFFQADHEEIIDDCLGAHEAKEPEIPEQADTDKENQKELDSSIPISEELLDDCLGTQETKEPEISEQADTDKENQKEQDLSTPISEELLILPEHTPVIITSTVLDETSDVEDDESVDETELLSDIKEDDSAIEVQEPSDITIEIQESDDGFGSHAADETIEPTQAPDEGTLPSSLPQEAVPTQIPFRSISSEDFTASINISQLVLEKTTNGYKTIKDMALVLAINNCSDQAIRVQAVFRFEAGVSELYEALGFTMPRQSKDIILDPGEEQSMTWPFYCGQDLSSGTVSIIPAETDLAFRVDFICEWDDVI